MIVQVKAVWQAIPLHVESHDTRAEVAWEGVLSLCLQSYYANELSPNLGPP